MRDVLFVDDEEAVLDGLQDSLRGHRRRWNMDFACGGEAAIAQLATGSYDVIVSDIRMPGVGGVEVLQYAKEHHPKTIRIALTGYSDDTSTIELTKLAQRYLTKPCSVEDLDNAICRDSGLIEAFDLPIVQELAGSAGRLPSSDGVQQELMRCLNAADTSVNEIAEIIEKDVALTAKVLQLVNSSFFRRQSSIVSARHAIVYLGLDVMRSLLLADQLFNSGTVPVDNSGFNIKALYRHSMLCSSIAKSVAPIDDLVSVSMTAGLLHDIGKIVIARARPELVPNLLISEYDRCYAWVDSATERQVLGCTHSEVGGYFLNLWGIPTDVVEAVTYHDNPSSVFTKKIDTVGIVHISNYLAHWVVGDYAEDEIENKLDIEFISKLDAVEQLDDWKEIAQQVASDSDVSIH